MIEALYNDVFFSPIRKKSTTQISGECGGKGNAMRNYHSLS